MDLSCTMKGGGSLCCLREDVKGRAYARRTKKKY